MLTITIESALRSTRLPYDNSVTPDGLDQINEAARAEPAHKDCSRNEASFFDVPWWLHRLGGFVDRHPRFWLRLAKLETSAAAQHLEDVRITAPIFICGLARSGSTLLHEVVASHPAVATHRIKDYPFVFMPYWWRRATARLRASVERERAHHDRVMITSESPDALEEMLWMAFFPDCHNPLVTNVLGAEDRYPEFESFYEMHIRKLLLAEHMTRYAAKANYHVARLAYLVRLFPDARFLIPVRRPIDHIVSLMRQHEWFSQGHKKYPRALAFMQRSGHFEFGLDRRPINMGDSARVQQILLDWAAGQEVRGLAHYWDMVYAYLGRLLASDERVRAATLTVPFERFCESPAETLRGVFEHVGLSDAESIVERFAPAIRRPDYYTSKLTDDDRSLITDTTAATAALWGYQL